MALVVRPSGAVWNFGNLPPSQTIFRGPTEILSRISTFAAWDDEVGVQALRLLCSINRHWRNVVLETPEAWAKIRVYNDAYHRYLRGPRKVLCTALDVEEWFKRSKNAPLDVALRLNIRFRSAEDAVFCDFVLDLIRQNAVHVHKLSLGIFHGNGDALRLDRLGSAQWPWLRALHLDYFNVRDAAEILPLLASASRAPRLRDVHLANSRCVTDTLLPPRLRVELTHLRLARYSKREILTNFGICRALRVLRIDDLQQATAQLAVRVKGPAITLPCLETLELCLERPWYTNIFETGLLHVPALLRFAIRVSELSCFYRGQYTNLGAARPLNCTPILKRLLDNSNPPLEELELDNAMVAVEEFVPVALRMAGLKKFLWRYSHNVQVVKDLVNTLSTTTTSDGIPVWLFPQLADLYVSLGKNGVNNVASGSRRQTHAMMQPFLDARTRVQSPLENSRGVGPLGSSRLAQTGHRALGKTETAVDEARSSCDEASCLAGDMLDSSIGAWGARDGDVPLPAASLENGAFAAVAPPQMVRWYSGDSAMKASALHSWEWVNEPFDKAEWIARAAASDWDNV